MGHARLRSGRRDGQVAGGANLLAFTTGRGSAYGMQADALAKLATTPEIYRHMIDDMDIDCGEVLDGVSIEAKAGDFRDAAEGRPPRTQKSEQLGYGDAEFAPWTIGAGCSAT